MSPNEPEADDLPQPAGGRRRDDRRRVRGPAQWVLIGVSVGIGVGFAVVLLLSQTAWGRGQVLTFTLAQFGGRLNGDLTVERLEGNLVTGARLYGITLTDTVGVPLAEVDSAYIQYRLASFLGGDIVINRLEAYDADINIFRMPGDTLWNYEEILEDPTPDPAPPETAGATLIERMLLFDVYVTMRAPLEADSRLSAEAQEEQIREILADTARYMIEEVPGGHLQTTLIDVNDGAVSELFIGPDERGGTYLEVTEGTADIRLWRDPPLEVRDVQARLHLQEGVLSYQAPEIVLPNSRGESVGTVDLRGDRLLYDLVITSPEFALADLRWLYPWLPEDPEQGTGSAWLRVEDREEGLLVLARELVLDMPGTHITGTFGLIAAPETFRFVDVELEAEPLRVESVEQLLPADLPVEGLVIGGAEIRGAS
ncbi:MAG: hypothetical protein WD737_13390 [Gemmatimonadota bacterium]